MVTERKTETINLGNGKLELRELPLRKYNRVMRLLGGIFADRRDLLGKLNSDKTEDILYALSQFVKGVPETMAEIFEMASTLPPRPWWAFWRSNPVQELMEEATPSQLGEGITVVLRMNNIFEAFLKKAPGAGSNGGLPELKTILERSTGQSPASPSKPAGASSSSTAK